MKEQINFRNLKPNEIQIRPTDTKTKGRCTLLLYQDARCGMTILDETLGQFNWQKKYDEVAGNVYCSVGIKDNESNEWIWKSDCGIESNIEAEKGQASDAFKRACVNWGIGRELYTVPDIKIKCPDSYYFNDKLCMSFYVKDIQYEGKSITLLIVSDKFDNQVFTYNSNSKFSVQKKTDNRQNDIDELDYKESDRLEELKSFCSEKKTEDGVNLNALKKFYTFYSSADKDNPKMTVAETRKYWNVQKMWNKWLSMEN